MNKLNWDAISFLAMERKPLLATNLYSIDDRMSTHLTKRPSTANATPDYYVGSWSKLFYSNQKHQLYTHYQKNTHQSLIALLRRYS